MSGATLYQGSTIGIYCICMYAYFYWCMHNFGHLHIDTYAYFFPIIFSKFSKFFLFIVCKWVPVPLFKAPISWPSLLPLLKIFVAPPLFPVPSPFKVFSTVPYTFTQILSALTWPTNRSWFKQISKGQIYQFNCCFLSKINFNLLNPFTNNLNLWDIFRCIFRQLKKTFFHKIMVAEKNNFSSNNSTILQRVK